MSIYPGKGKVAVVKTSPETVLEDIDRLMKMAEVEKALSKDVTTGLKINISWQTWYPACSSTPWQIEGVIKTLQSLGYNDLLGIHNDTVVVDTSVGEANNKHKFVTNKYGIPCTYLYQQQFEWIEYKPKKPFLVLDKVYPDGVFIPKTLVGKNIVHLPTVKTHVFTTITGAMKNAFGGLLHRNRHWTHSVIHETLVDLLSIQQEIHPGIFAVMDGTFAGDGPGPRAMRWHEKNILLASADQVAIDAVSAKLQGFDPMSIQFISQAHEHDLGVGDPNQIEIVGYDIEQEQPWKFVQEDTFASRGQKMIYHGWLKPLEKPLLQTPIVGWSYFASNFYHNVYWYPFVGRQRVREALKTPWGQLFEKYGDGQVVMPGMEPKTVIQAGIAIGAVTALLVTAAVLLSKKNGS
ncbi:MAG: iron-sulfur cluster-binding protein [Chloroflexi bacterium GWB2_54_36]|nr:MAG: iron-sulfur cluster-binding protein [Chloroflexi bacterium GWB2_54_36]